MLARFLAVGADVGTGEDVEESVRRCRRLRSVERIIMVLSQVALHLYGRVGVVEGRSVAYDIVSDVGRPPRCRRVGQVFRVGGLVQLHAVDV